MFYIAIPHRCPDFEAKNINNVNIIYNVYNVSNVNIINKVSNVYKVNIINNVNKKERL
jgi:hypothetical protein